jgi:predicted nuclease of predicted toxin-antitoxin system
MHFLIDTQLPRVLARHLRGLGLEATHVGGLGLAQASDHTIWTRVRETRGAVLITKDHDFVRLQMTEPVAVSIIWLRFGNSSNRDLIDRVDQEWPRVMASLRAGEALIEIA